MSEFKIQALHIYPSDDDIDMLCKFTYKNDTKAGVSHELRLSLLCTHDFTVTKIMYYYYNSLHNGCPY